MISPLYSQSSQPVSDFSATAKKSGGESAPVDAKNTQKPEDKSAIGSDVNNKTQTQQPETATQSKKGVGGVDLNSPEVKQMLAELKARDTEVRAHEQAHLAAAGQYATSGASYSYQSGPDGKEYAIGGEVGIDTSAVSGDPQATLAKAQQVLAAALAPASPSSQDFSVAQSAQQMMAQAFSEIQAENKPDSDEQQEDSTQKSGSDQKDDGTQKTAADDKISSDNTTATDAQKATTDNAVSTSTDTKTNSEKSTDSQWTSKASAYQRTEQATNALAGQVGGWQNAANRLGISFQA